MAISELALPEGVIAHCLKKPQQMATSLAHSVADALRQAIVARGVATLVVSGGRSPIAFFEALATQPLDWAKVVISLADERWVAVTHPDSNEGLLRKHLLQGPCAAARFVGLYHGGATLQAAAKLADEALAYLPPIDVLVLGMGDDGHCASLFAGNPQLDEALLPGNTTRCVPMLAPGVPHQRISMTYALLASANAQFLAVQGAGKLDTLQQVVSDLDATSAMPVRAFMRPPLQIYWSPQG
ncbi:6-phosphogluconolactonase [Pseudomonas marincola]|uniref:6-phosphogluconolactonase n=1 Tax=Pseudomonas marincola TaxID=437900 RepID=UPI0008F33FA7|nr:6-phosphogluconolactonase [Pseudomonas marincola]SFU17106.1 6-phosphogluconolactonase [Pseudomonas marincola]